MVNPNIVIEVSEDSAEVSYRKNYVHYKKTISIESLINAMASQSGIKLPHILPPGCRFYSQKGETHTLFLEIPPLQRKIVYVNRSEKPIFEGVVPMPWGLLKLSCTASQPGSYCIGSGYIYALKRPLLTEKDPLFLFPTANVYSSGSICWGTTFPKDSFKSFVDLGKAVDYFFSSQFNTDISPALVGYSRYEDLLRDIEGKKEFPLDVLRSASLKFSDIAL